MNGFGPPFPNIIGFENTTPGTILRVLVSYQHAIDDIRYIPN